MMSIKRITGLCRVSIIALLVLGSFSVTGRSQSLVEAVKNQNQAVVASLIEQGVDVNEAEGDGTTALIWAVHGSDVEIADLLIGSGADVNLANDYGHTALSQACTNGNSILAQKLLDAGANPNSVLWTGETVLMTCSHTGAAGGVQALLQHGADLHAAEQERGQTALMWAAAQGHPNVIRVLLEHGADLHARSRTVDLYEPLIAVTYSKNVYLPEVKGGFTPLMFAAQSGDLESVQALVEAGADVNDATPDDGSALVLAATNGHEEVGIYLLEKGADPNAADGYGITALHWTMQQGIAFIYSRPSRTDRFWNHRNSPELAKALLVRGADPNARIAKDFLPWDIHRYARTLGNELPQADFAGATPFLLAAASGDADTMRFMLEAKASPGIATLEGLTPLMVAAGVGRERNAATDEERKGYLEALQLALDLGGDVNAKGPGGRAAVHGATILGETGVLRILAENGADLEAEDQYGQTPMSIALGDPGQFSYKPLPGGETDRRFRELAPLEEIADFLLELGATPYTGPVADRSGQ